MRDETTVRGFTPTSVTAWSPSRGVIRLRQDAIDGDQLTADLSPHDATTLANAILKLAEEAS